MPRLLIVTHYFPPSAASGSFRTLGFACHLPLFGWDVSVVSSGPNPWQPDSPELMSKIPKRTRVEYVDFPLDRAKRLLPVALQKMRVMDLLHVWNRPALAVCEKVIKRFRPDAVLTTSPPHSIHFLGRKLAKQYSLPWLIDLRDPWCTWGNDTPYVTSMLGVANRFERRSVSEAAATIMNSPNACRMMQEAYPRAQQKIHWVTNGFDPIACDDFTELPRDRDEFWLVHTGAIHARRDPRPLLDAMARIARDHQGDRNIRLSLVGRNCDTELEHEIKERGLEARVELVDQLPYDTVKQYLVSADAAVLLDTPGRRIGVPAKLYEYLATGRPVLAFADSDGDTANVLNNSGVEYRLIPPNTNTEEIVRALRWLIDGNRNRSATTNGQLERDQYTRRATASRLASILDSIVGHVPKTPIPSQLVQSQV